MKRPGAAGAAETYARRGGTAAREASSSSSKASDGVDVRPLDEWLHGHAEAKGAGLAERVYPWGMPLSFFLEVRGNAPAALHAIALVACRGGTNLLCADACWSCFAGPRRSARR